MKHVASSAKDLSSELEAMLHDGFLDGLVRLLDRRFPAGAGTMSEDSVAEAIRKTIGAGRSRTIENPRGYVTTIATNEMRASISRAAIETLPQANEDEQETWEDRLPAPAEDDPEVQVRGRLVYEFVRTLVDAWESRNLKTTTLLVLEGSFLGEALSGEELAERASDLLDKDVSASTARQWRKRGLDRLRAQLVAEGFEID